MLQKDKPATTPKRNPRPWWIFAALLVGFLALSAIAWFGTHKYITGAVNINTVHLAEDWTRQVVAELKGKENVFVSRKLRINDKYALKDYQKGTTIFRYRLIADDGRVFWSSRFEENGMVEKRALFRDKIKHGQTAVVHLKTATKSIEQISTISHAHQTQHARNMDALHDVVEVIIPIANNGKIAGAMSLLFDNTDVFMRSRALAFEIATFAIFALAMVFLVITIMIWVYGTSRNKKNHCLHQAKRKAEEAETKALKMADALQDVNADVIKLNVELNKNMKIIHDSQNEIIRKGKMAQLGQLTATVAHDIRNPLGSVRTSAFLLRRKFATANPEMNKPLSRIEKGIERCDGIITQLLDFARSKDVLLKKRNLDNWLINLLREQAEELPQELSFECNLGLNDREYAFDSENIARAIINFLTNASEAMVGKGKDKPEHITPNPVISVSTAITNRGIEITVSDNGPGILAKNIDKIMEPLFTTKSFGVGLGLPAVEKIFEQHGGGMEIFSQEGHGATFTGWIAIKKPEEDSNEPVAA